MWEIRGPATEISNFIFHTKALKKIRITWNVSLKWRFWGTFFYA
jgi:hypothetical protein